MGKPVECRRWSATVDGEPDDEPTVSRDTRAVAELRLSRHTDRGSEAVRGRSGATLSGLDREAREHEACPPPGCHRLGSILGPPCRYGTGDLRRCDRPPCDGESRCATTTATSSQTGRWLAPRSIDRQNG